MKKIPKPKQLHNQALPFCYEKSMCGTCAYAIKLTADEIEFERDMRMLRPERYHPCHERMNVWCVGSVETQKLFEMG